jgi:hypothetical protein
MYRLVVPMMQAGVLFSFSLRRLFNKEKEIRVYAEQLIA